jgi:hypothetical protein
MAQLFTQQHYDAFTPPKPTEDDPIVRKERERVKEQLLWLDSSLAQFIQDQKWNLHRHHQPQHYTSSTHFVWINVDTGEVDDKEGPIGRWQPIVKEIGWLWLHYGKSKEQLNFYKSLPGVYQYSRRDDSDYYNAFYVHTRIQFYLSNNYFGVWLLYTDKNRYDKSEFLKKIRQQPLFKADFWKRLQPILNLGFSYVVGDDELPLANDLDQEDLFRFILKSHAEGYSGIRKMYNPEDPRISVENIVTEMKTNLTLLYPLYDLMAIRQKGPGFDPRMLFGGNARVK